MLPLPTSEYVARTLAYDIIARVQTIPVCA
jgi:hypothetical protein